VYPTMQRQLGTSNACLSCCRDLSHNELRGRLKWNWSALKGTTYINLSDNNLSGEFPPSWSSPEGLTDVKTLCAPLC
jgi:hypothetical protein